mgnify:CR=1 FL=1
MRRQFTMPKKISATVLFTCLLFGLVSWLLLFAQTDQLAKQAIDDKGISSLAQLHEAILTPLLSNDTISQQVSLQRATEDERVISASLMDIEGQLIAQSASNLLKTTKTKTFKQAIAFQNTQAGIISVEVNSQPIMAQYHRVFINWLLLWLAFTVLCTYGCYRFVDQITARIERLSERLPGKTEPLADEISALETKIQPLLSTSGDSSLAPNNKYFYSLVSGNIKNNQRLLAQLNRDNLDQLLEKLDYCILRTLQLYGGERIEGTEDSFCFAIRSTHCSKQHLLVCLMAVYSLQQLVEQLSKKSGIELEINWIISSDDIVLSVRDNGIGLSDLDTLFEPFHTTKPAGDGVGLGLAISSGILAELDGRLTARNAAAGGAVFEITLPAFTKNTVDISGAEAAE